MNRILFIGLFLLLAASGLARQRENLPVKGIVLQSSDQEVPLPGANVVLKGTTTGTVTNETGEFVLDLPAGSHTLVISFIGYHSQEINVEVPVGTPLRVSLIEDAMSLAEVQIVSTGFQDLPAERTTGSFAFVDKALVERRVSTNILDRLEDVTPGLIFNRDRTDLGPGESISIRGNSTLMSDRRPLIVVDNLIYDGPIENLNPNDVENITVLRDAAAASIWGARAGNGVIVIKTRRGEFSQPMRVGLNSNLTLGKAFDPFYDPKMSINDFIKVEQRLFGEGFYDFLYDGFTKQNLSPVVEDLFAKELEQITDQELQARLNAYENRDVRRHLQQYLYRPSLNQQYALNVSGGSAGYSYLFSLGYDSNMDTQVDRSRSRITVNGQQNWKLVGDKLELGLGTYLISNQRQDGFPQVSGIYPYESLVDEEGNPLSVIRNFNPRFKSNAVSRGALDWNYEPLREIGLTPLNINDTETRLNFRIGWKILDGLMAESNYQYWGLRGNQEQVYSSQSYFARNLVNLYTQLPAGASPVYGIPLGGIRDYGDQSGFSHTWRTQLNYNKSLGAEHKLNGLAGFELRDLQRQSNFNRYYGYDEETGISRPVNYTNFFTQLNTGFGAQIPFGQSQRGSIDRFTSWFSNLGYSFQDKYLATVSARIDASNLFGVETNQKRVPLWSAGLGWILSEENWLQVSWIDYLKLRASYGYTGNTNPAATAYTTGILFGSNTNPWVGLPWMSLLNPPNPEVRWEKIKIINLGMDWELAKGRITGSLEFYQKQGTDLFGVQPYFPSSGNLSVTRNYADTRTNGMDLNLSGRILDGPLRWTSNWFHSFVKEEVTRYANTPRPQNVASYSSGRAGLIPEPVKGFPLYSIFSFPSAGLDPSDGSPRGLLDGEPSKDYSKIFNQTTLEGLVFHGSAIPTHFGAWRNQFNWKGWELSANISYRLGYYFRRETIDYTTLNRGNITHSDYTNRWQNPGDELITQIPSDPLTVNQTRSTFELVNSSRIRKGDHIRLQDIQLAYSFNNWKRLPFESAKVYAYANQMGLIWKSAKDVRDPDFRTIQALPSLSVGINLQF